jgi:hypothetical protein
MQAKPEKRFDRLPQTGLRVLLDAHGNGFWFVISEERPQTDDPFAK